MINFDPELPVALQPRRWISISLGQQVSGFLAIAACGLAAMFVVAACRGHAVWEIGAFGIAFFLLALVIRAIATKLVLSTARRSFDVLHEFDSLIDGASPEEQIEMLKAWPAIRSDAVRSLNAIQTLRPRRLFNNFPRPTSQDLDRMVQGSIAKVC